MTSAPTLPALPAGVTELKFQEFFALPVGPRGLTVTQKLHSLDGKHVRILGYMARQTEPYPGFFLFTPLPIQLDEREYGQADDLPPTVVFVHLAQYTEHLVPYMAGPLLLIGTLSVGSQEERDGRVSTVRLILDMVPQAMADRIGHAAPDAPSPSLPSHH